MGENPDLTGNYTEINEPEKAQDFALKIADRLTTEKILFVLEILRLRNRRKRKG